MLRVRRANERGGGDHGWLTTRHTFSFADYFDPAYTSFRTLRVMNEDWVQPGTGFGMHPHRDMEIVTYVLEGALEHRDSLGNGDVLRAGEMQRMTAGTGILHSEYNPSSTEPVHLYQVWILPERKGLTPGYEQKRFDPEARRGPWQVVAARDGRDGSMIIHQDAQVLLAGLEPGQQLAYALQPGRHAWLQVTRGSLTVNSVDLSSGDGLAVSDERNLTLQAAAPAEVMLFDLP